VERHDRPQALREPQQHLRLALFLFKDLHRYFDKPEIVRKLRDLAPSFKMDRRVIVLSAAQLTLPAELQTLAGTFTLDLPSAEELKAIAGRVVADLSRRRPVRMDLAPDDFDRLVERMKGFTELEAERAITKTVLRDGALSRSGLEAMVEIKKELLQKEGILEYIAPEENLAEVGGFRNLKAWLAKRRRAFAPEAKKFGLAGPRGILSSAFRAPARPWSRAPSRASGSCRCSRWRRGSSTTSTSASPRRTSRRR
jgi:hypothetical protein